MNGKRHFFDFLSLFIHNQNMKKDLQISKLKSLGIFTPEEALHIGISQPSLFRLLKKGIILRYRRGFYCHVDSKIEAEHVDYIIAIKKFGPSSVIGLWSALQYHHLTEAVPQQIWVIVPREVKTKDKLYRCIRVTTNPKIGILDFKYFKITNVERTIIECFRFASKVGLSTAIQAAKISIRNQMTTAKKIMKLSKEMGLEKYIIKHWESIYIE